MEILCLFGHPFFKIKFAGILNFQWIKYLGRSLSYLKNWGIGVYYCWNYEPSKLLLHFTEYRIDQLNNKHTKIVVNSAIQYFEGRCQKKCLLKVWRFLVHPPQHGGPVKFLQNWTETIFDEQYFQTSQISGIWFTTWAKSDLPITNSIW